MTAGSHRLLRRSAALVAMVGLCATAAAQMPPPPPAATADTPAGLVTPTYRLWPGRAPGATGDRPEDVPTLTLFRPVGPPGGAAVVIAPGGAYLGLASGLEGSQPAEWFAARGIAAFVLTYRVGATARLPTVLQDGARAMRYVRANAARFGVDPKRVGMLGFSAGGHLAASVATGMADPAFAPQDDIDRASSRPDFLVLGYPWLRGTMVGSDGRSQYCDFAARLKIPCRPADYAGYVPLRSVGASTPPTFIYHTTDDELVPVGGSIDFFQALHAAGVPVELHALEHGRHGTGLGGADLALSGWPEALDRWLRGRGLIAPPAPRPAAPPQ